MSKEKIVSFAFGDPCLPLTNMTDDNSIPITLDVPGMLYEFANAEVYGADEAEYLRSNAEEFASTVSKLLEELDSTEISEVRQILDKYGVIL